MSAWLLALFGRPGLALAHDRRATIPVGLKASGGCVGLLTERIGSIIVPDTDASVLVPPALGRLCPYLARTATWANDAVFVLAPPSLVQDFGWKNGTPRAH